MKDYLRHIEEEHGVRVLFACETGSRGWGFPSTDSDYDVRFMFVHPRDRYLELSDPKADLSFFDGELDFVGWDLKKVLKLTKKSNATINEKLRSPIIYKEELGFREELGALVNAHYSPVAGGYHYHNLCRSFRAEYFNDDNVLLKKFFYVVRSTLAAKWCVEKYEAPPMELNSLLGVVDDRAFCDEVVELVKIKATVGEGFKFCPTEKIVDKLNELHVRNEAALTSLPSKSKNGYDELNEFFKRWI